MSFAWSFFVEMGLPGGGAWFMDKEHVKGAADKAKRGREGCRWATSCCRPRGRWDKAKGDTRQTLGDAKDAVKHSRDEE